MAELKTNYLGLKLKNPIIVGASNLVTKTDNLKQIEESGAAAIVYKSLFEEQVQLEALQLQNELGEYNDRNAEMISLFPDIDHAGPEEHLFNLAQARKVLSIPLIASLNAIAKQTWIDYAKKIESTGVDALELNFYAVPRSLDDDGSKIVNEQLDVLKAVKAAVKIPVSVKLSPFYANPLNIISQMDKTGVDGFVLFNRLFQPDVDLSTETHFSPHNLSNPEDYKLALRFAGLLYNEIEGSIIANAGIYEGADVAKLILAGADAVQVVSTLYKNKIPHLIKMLADLSVWMDSKGYKTLDDFKGKLSRKNTKDPFVYKRAQYIDVLLKSEEIFKKYPVL